MTRKELRKKRNICGVPFVEGSVYPLSRVSVPFVEGCVYPLSTLL